MAYKIFRIAGTEDLIKAVEGFGRQGRAAIVQAVNRVATGARTDAVTLIRQHLMLKAKAVRSGLSVTKAKVSDYPSPRAILTGRGKRGIPLMNYPVRPSKIGGRKPKVGVSAQIKRHGARKTVRGSFVARMKSGHVGVFKRNSGAPRLPIRELSGVGFIGYLERGMVGRQLAKRISERLTKELTASVRNMLRKLEGRK
ncbi:MAG: phage tail protein [Pseudodesulfovibrio sp.]|uniref:phage tail protein n=1 Tax=Pseudodesulfovibrio sp. TaxID=2035812 RepID=UPI003D10CE2E